MSVMPTVPDTVSDTDQYNTVGWEAGGLFRLTTRLIAGTSPVADKEIDVDDREAYLLVTLEMASEIYWEWKAINIQVELLIDSTGPNASIAINDLVTGSIMLIATPELFPGSAASNTIKVSTGVFSTALLNELSAQAGTKNYRVKLTYELVPIVGSARQTTNTKLIFYVADD